MNNPLKFPTSYELDETQLFLVTTFLICSGWVRPLPSTATWTLFVQLNSSNKPNCSCSTLDSCSTCSSSSSKARPLPSEEWRPFPSLVDSPSPPPSCLLLPVHSPPHPSPLLPLRPLQHVQQLKEDREGSNHSEPMDHPHCSMRRAKRGKTMVNIMKMMRRKTN